jgi:SAM-dependent methyltransferase
MSYAIGILRGPFRASGRREAASMTVNQRIYRALRGDKSLTLAAGVLLIFVFVLGPLAPHDAVLRVGAIGSLAAFLGVAGCFVYEPRPATRAFIAVLAATAISYAAAQYVDDPRIDAVGAVFLLVSGIVLGLVYIGRAFKDGRINKHRLMGAVVAFVLVGVVFAQAYRITAYLAPEAFAFGRAPATLAELLPRLTDFSFLTLSSLGFGDITPVHPIARMLASAEALIGALLVAILIARLVAKELEWRRELRELAEYERSRVAFWDDPMAVRARIAEPYLRGSGIEIGALDVPTKVPPGALVRYVDFRTPPELALQYPDLDARGFVPADVVDDGERLDKLADESIDFIIANQMLEHCENPLGTIRQHLKKLKPAGWLFYAVPDRRLSFDSKRPITPFEHLVADDADNGTRSRFGHYLEWSKLVNNLGDDKEAEAQACANAAQSYSIHFHVWDANAWFEFLVRARDYLGNAFDIQICEFTGTEIVCVLRKACSPIERAERETRRQEAHAVARPPQARSASRALSESSVVAFADRDRVAHGDARRGT